MADPAGHQKPEQDWGGWTAPVAGRLQSEPLSFVCRFLDSTDSTNRLARDLAGQGGAAGLVLVAETQTAGRGRLQRQWYSPAGTNLYLSLILRPDVPPAHGPQVSLLAGLALAAAVRDACPGLGVLLKWPNDLLAANLRKLAGILCEVSADSGRLHYIVVGIGVNVNQERFPAELADSATSLLRETGGRCCRITLLANLLNNFNRLYAQWLREGFAPLAAAWNRDAALIGRRVGVNTPAGQVHGELLGIDATGALLLLDDEQRPLTIHSGDVGLLDWRPEGTENGKRKTEDGKGERVLTSSNTTSVISATPGLDPALAAELDTAAVRNRRISAAAAQAVLECPDAALPAVFAAANALRLKNFGNRAHLCSILNARSGACSEDCAFCAQAACHKGAKPPVFPMLPEAELVRGYREAGKLPVGHFGVVTSGGALPPAELERVLAALASQPAERVHWCASLGCLAFEQLQRLRQAGLRRFHHNLETAASFFPSICSTHTYAERLRTLRDARRAGLELCSGGILGLGENLAQRVELAETLAIEQVEAIPLNFLVPIPGTRTAGLKPMAPLDILRSIAMFRLVNPTAEVKVCAGRLHLRDLQSMIFFAGATGMMVGPLLTVAGRDVPTDLQMLHDLGLELVHHAHA